MPVKVDTIGGSQEMSCVSEAGMYSLSWAFWRKLEEFIRKTLEKREKMEETDGNQ